MGNAVVDGREVQTDKVEVVASENHFDNGDVATDLGSGTLVLFGSKDSDAIFPFAVRQGDVVYGLFTTKQSANLYANALELVHQWSTDFKRFV